EKQIGIRADRFHFVRDGGEANFIGIRRKVDVARAAALVRRHVVIRSGIQVAGLAAAIGSGNKRMTAFAFEPVRPMAIQELLVHMSLYLVFVLLLVPLLVAH